MKIRALSTEGVCRRHRLGLKAVFAHGAAQNDFPQRRHSLSPLLAALTRRNFYASFYSQVAQLMPLFRFSCQRIFSHPEARCALFQTRDLVVDADQPAA
jgi:hypothetical protein